MRRELSNQPIDLLVLDLMLPGEDGLSLCRAVREDSSIPIIMLTARGADPLDRGVDIRISRLRQLLRDDAREPALIRTVGGEGYTLDVDVATE